MMKGDVAKAYPPRKETEFKYIISPTFSTQMNHLHFIGTGKLTVTYWNTKR